MKRKNASRQRAEQRAIAVLRDVLGAERFGEWLLNGFVELGEFILVAPNNKQAYRQGYPGGFPPFLYLYGIDDTGVLVLYGFQTDLRLLEDALAQLVLWAESRPEKLRQLACLWDLPWSFDQSKLPRRLHTALTRMWLSGLKRAPPHSYIDYEKARLLSELLTFVGDCPDLQSQIRTELTACRIRKAISLNAREKKELAALVKHCPEMVEIVDDLDLIDVAELVRDF